MNLFDVVTDFFTSPAVNIDGTPMVGDIDINGNPFGVTNDIFSSTSFNDTFSSGFNSLDS